MRIHRLLWTGGWDSTYRLLDLVINNNRKVQPYYIYDSGRKSAGMEIETMRKILNLINDMDPAYSKNIFELIEIQKTDIPDNIEITARFRNLLSLSYLGSQYDWLARYAESMKIFDLELAIHVDDKAHYFIQDHVEEISEDNDFYFKLKENVPDENLMLFRYFHFPLLKMTKLDMELSAKKSGFSHIMEVTWFCHSPINGNPCGTCNPCKYTRDEGLGRRVPNPPMSCVIVHSLKKGLSKLIRKN